MISVEVKLLLLELMSKYDPLEESPYNLVKN